MIVGVGGPKSERYVHYEGKSLDWWQAYETVSEGTPVSPAFASPEELIEYLVINGDFWDQRRKERGMSHLNPNHSREAIEAFVRGGWAPSMAIIEGKLYSGIDSLTASKEEVDEIRN